MMQRKRSFSETVRNLETKNSERLMRKARRANRIAKSLRGAGRRLAYSVKSSALVALATKLPAKSRVRSDNVIMDFVVVELKQGKGGLHCPAKLF